MSNDNRLSEFLTVTESDLAKFAPRARREYVVALLGGLFHLRAAGILDNNFRLCHFMGQIGHETDGLTILRESLTYRTADRLRTVWPARFRNKTDAELAQYVGNPAALGDVVYGGRMGNNTSGDGYGYRGGGWLQTTGKDAVTRYASRLGLEASPALLDDAGVTLQFACLEWQEAHCSACADENDLTKVSKAINTGSATGNIKPVGMSGRQEWFNKAWAIWGERGRPDTIAKPPMSITAGMAKVGAPVVAGAELVRQIGIPAVPDSVSQAMSNAEAWRGIVQVGTSLASETGLLLVATGALAFAGVVWLGKRMGWHL